jgi:hypothetical protein
MKRLEFLAGTRINEAAHELVLHAPACADFNGITIRARYATTNPSDIVAKFTRDTDNRHVAWTQSRAGRAAAADMEARRRAMQNVMDGLLAALPMVDMTSPIAVLTWVKAALRPADMATVTYDHEMVVERFRAHGWEPGANCDDDFRPEDARNVAGWIVGQWLVCRHPMLERFIEDWANKFVEAA